VSEVSVNSQRAFQASSERSFLMISMPLSRVWVSMPGTAA
jgi:hypothetical protein